MVTRFGTSRWRWGKRERGVEAGRRNFWLRDSIVSYCELQCYLRLSNTSNVENVDKGVFAVESLVDSIEWHLLLVPM